MQGQCPGREGGTVQHLHGCSQPSPTDPVQSWEGDQGAGKRTEALEIGPGCLEENWGAEKRTGMLEEHPRGSGLGHWEEVWGAKKRTRELGRELRHWEEDQDAIKRYRELGGGLRCREVAWGAGRRTGMLGRGLG